MAEDKNTASRKIILQPNTLWMRAVEQTQSALSCGALKSIATNYEFIEENGIRFLVRSLANLVRKDAAKQQEKKKAVAGKDFNPFLPYEKDLFVADISDTHLCLLNKYNVVENHLLIITRSFEEQDNWLTQQDFEAMGACLAAIDGLVFYNGGQEAGASQRHKHLQIVPFPLIPDGERIPIASALATATFVDGIGTTAHFPFRHAFAKVEWAGINSPLEAGKVAREVYGTLLKAVGLPYNPAEEIKQSGAYNLLATREWIMIVPRSRESFESISVNSLGFAGTMFVRNQEQMEVLKQQGIMRILSEVGYDH